MFHSYETGGPPVSSNALRLTAHGLRRTAHGARLTAHGGHVRRTVEHEDAPMRTDDVSQSLATLFSELVEGAPATGGYMLNAGDDGLLRSLDRLSAAAASALTPTGSSIAAHVDHLRYGLSLLNRWNAGENPFGDADWSASWKRTTVSDEEWQRLRSELRAETARWLDALRTPREVRDIELNGMIGSIAHLAYHLGAIRQIDSTLRGPADSGA
jgi:hypothetical protein